MSQLTQPHFYDVACDFSDFLQKPAVSDWQPRRWFRNWIFPVLSSWRLDTCKNVVWKGGQLLSRQLLICPIEKGKRLLLDILSFLKRSQQQHNALLLLTRSAQLPHQSRVSCLDLFAPWKTTTKCRERRRNMHQEPLTFFYQYRKQKKCTILRQLRLPGF